MKYLRVFLTAISALRRNLTRSMLTTLGIIIGIAAVIAIVEIGHGSRVMIQMRIESMGANMLVVSPGQAASGGVSFGAGTVVSLRPDDCDAILRECSAVRAAAPLVRARVQIVYGNKNWVPNSIYGSTAAYLDVRNWTEMSQGAPFTDHDVRNRSKVCILGQTVVHELFGDESPIGKEVRVQNVAFRVVGVLAQKGANLMGQDQDDVLIAPWTTIKYRVAGQSAQTVNQSAANSTSNAVNSLSSLYPTGDASLYPVPSSVQEADTPQPIRFTNVDQILCAAVSADDIPLAIRQVTAVIHDRHRIRADEPDDFTIFNMTDMTNMMTGTMKVVTGLLLCVASISLVVGGVGIMNIMLVSVTERTREIGLRMAVGARARDILRQFLVEAVVLCLLGGTMGILIGRGASLLVRYIAKWPTAFSLSATVTAVAVSATVGIVFGYYPAWKASRLDPIEALRYE